MEDPKKSDQILAFMQLVFEEVERAIQEGNPPFAALITDSDNNIITIARNQQNTKKICIAHAELEAISNACVILCQKQLTGCKIYTNAESCAMCSGAIIKSGISHVFYGAPFEQGSNHNPNIYLREINEKATQKLVVEGGFMQDIFQEQIQRGRNVLCHS